MSSTWFESWFDKLLERYGGLELLQLLLMEITFGTASLGLSVIVSRLSISFMFMLAIIGVLVAWMLTRTRLSNWGFGVTGILLGSFGLLLTIGQIGNSLFVLLFSVFPPLAQLLQKESVDFSGIVNAWQALERSLSTLLARFGNWFHGVTAHSLVIDPMVTSMLWGMALWLVIFWAIWWVWRRASVLPGLLPLIALLAYNVSYTNSSVGFTWLALTVGGGLMLQGCVSYGTAKQYWKANHLAQVEIESGLVLSVVLISIAMILAGSILPSIPFHQIADAINNAFHESNDRSLAKSLGLEQTPVPFPYSTPMVSSGIHLNEIHTIGPGPALDQAVVMFVSVDGYNPPPVNPYAVEVSQNSFYYYWRAQTYDTYNGRSWQADTTHTENIPANRSFLPGVDLASLPTNQKLITQHLIRIQTDEPVVFADGELLKLDQPSTVFRRGDEEIISASTEANQYTAVSRVLSPSVDQLRAAGSNYPVKLRPYLQLPDDVPQRVLDLALNLTADQSTPYDKAAVLEAYLRQFPYSRNVPGPPSDRDAVDFFLFDLKKGYCDYYASAMAVMARAAGLPARLVLGYTEGNYDPAKGAFVVRASNAHAWVEIYFPNIGWVVFEPTSNQTLPIRAGQTPEKIDAANLPTPGQESGLTIHLERTWMGRLILRIFSAVLMILFILCLPLETWWLTSLPTDQAMTKIFQRLYRRGEIFGVPPDPSRTPNEFSAALSSALEPFTTNKKKNPAITNLRSDLDCLTNLYTRLLFSEHSLQESDKQDAIRAWRNFRSCIRKIR